MKLSCRKIVFLALFLAVLMPMSVLALHTDSGCVGCHSPHNANTDAGPPLWGPADTNSTFVMYTSPTYDANDAHADAQPTGSSRLCLSCHDGADAGAPDLGTDLNNSHPISFLYDPALKVLDPSLNDPSTTLSTLGEHIDDDLLESGKMQCTSCHEIHLGGVGDYSLTIDDTGGVLCKICHNK